MPFWSTLIQNSRKILPIKDLACNFQLAIAQTELCIVTLPVMQCCMSWKDTEKIEAVWSRTDTSDLHLNQNYYSFSYHGLKFHGHIWKSCSWYTQYCNLFAACRLYTQRLRTGGCRGSRSLKMHIGEDLNGISWPRETKKSKWTQGKRT